MRILVGMELQAKIKKAAGKNKKHRNAPWRSCADIRDQLVQETLRYTDVLPSSRYPDALRVTLPGRRIVKAALRRPVELRRAVILMVAPVVV